MGNKAVDLFLLLLLLLYPKGMTFPIEFQLLGKLDESNNKSQFDKSRIKNPREVPFGQESIQEVQHFQKFLESFCPFTRFIDLLFSRSPVPSLNVAVPPSFFFSFSFSFSSTFFSFPPFRRENFNR